LGWSWPPCRLLKKISIDMFLSLGGFIAGLEIEGQQRHIATWTFLDHRPTMCQGKRFTIIVVLEKM
jgi:hypothetical protein